MQRHSPLTLTHLPERRLAHVVGLKTLLAFSSLVQSMAKSSPSGESSPKEDPAPSVSLALALAQDPFLTEVTSSCLRLCPPSRQLCLGAPTWAVPHTSCWPPVAFCVTIKGKQNGRCCPSVAPPAFPVLSGCTWLVAAVFHGTERGPSTIVGSLPGGAGLWTVWTPSPAPGALGGASVDLRGPVDTPHKA